MLLGSQPLLRLRCSRGVPIGIAVVGRLRPCRPGQAIGLRLAHERRLVPRATRSSGSAAGGGDEEDDLDSLSYARLKELCKEAGLPTKGKKVELIEQLEAHRAAQASAGQAEGGAEEEDDGEQEEDFIRQQLREMSIDEIAGILASRGEDTSGSQEELIDRLAAILEPELEREIKMDEQGGGEGESLEGAGGVGGVDEVDNATRDKLVQWRASQLRGQYGSWTRQQLYNELKTLVDYAYYGSKAELIASLSTAMAQKEVDQVVTDAPYSDKDTATLREWLDGAEAAAAVDEGDEQEGEEEEAPAPDRQTYERMSLSDIRKLRVPDLRLALKAVGLHAEGNRYEMMERLIAYRQSRRTSTIVEDSDNADELLQRVRAMSLRDIRSHLMGKGLPPAGSRQQMEERLYSAMLQEAKPRQEAAAEVEGAATAGDEDDVEWLESMGDLDLRTVLDDPNLTLAVVCGAPGGDLEDASASVAAARGIVEALHTAPLPRLAADGQADGAEGEEGWRSCAQGVKVQVFYVDRSGTGLHALTSQQLLAAGNAAAVEAVALAPAADQAFAAPLSGCHAVMPVLTGLPNGEALRFVNKHLKDSGLPCLGLPEEDAAVVASDKWKFTERIRELGYPTLPTYHLTPEDLQEGPEKLEHRLTNWCSAMGWDIRYKQLIIKPSVGMDGFGTMTTCGAQEAADCASQLLTALAEAGQGLESAGIVVQPWMGKGAVHFSCLVVEGPGGPLALLPSEIEIEDVDDAILSAALDHHRWELEAAGTQPDEIERELMEVQATIVPSPVFKTYSQGRKYLPHQTVRLHCPPRLPRKVVHAMRHASAKLFTQMGCKDVARVSGWAVLQPGWNDRYRRTDVDILPLIDPDAGQMDKLATRLAEAEAEDPQPLSAYYDDLAHAADLSAFNPTHRLDAFHNGGQASIYVADLHVAGQLAADLAPQGLAAQQAAELGMSHRSLVRSLVNSALRRAGITSASLSSGAAAAGAAETAEAGAGAEVVQLAAVRADDVYSRASLLSVAPDTWDLLKEMREQREDDRNSFMAQQAELEDQIGEYEELLNLLEDDLEGALKEDEAVQEALAQPDTPDLQYEVPELSVRVVDRWVPEDLDELEADVAAPEPEGGQDAPSMEGLSAPEGSVLALKEKYPHLNDDELMRLFLCETREGGRLDFDGFLEVCNQGPNASTAFLAQYDGVEDILMLEEGQDDEGGEGEARAEGEEGEEEDEELGDELWEGLGLEEGQGEAGSSKGAAAAAASAAAVDRVSSEAGPLTAPEGGEGEEEEGEEEDWTDRLPEQMQQEMVDLGMPPATVDAEVHRPVKVWVLMGGDHNQADESLASGLEVVRRLSHFSDLQVEPFLMMTGNTGDNLRRRRAALLRIRNEQLSLGSTPDSLDEHLQLEYIRDMPAPDTCLESEQVWALTQAAALQHSAEAVVDACERALRLATTNEFTLPQLDLQGMETRWDTQMELETGGVQGVGELWGGAYDARLPVPPRLLSLGQFANEAVDHDALVFVAMRGQSVLDGSVHRFLDLFGVHYTGSSAAATAAASSREVLAERLRPLEERGISTPPRVRLTTPFLDDIADDEDAATEALRAARHAIYGAADLDLPLTITPDLPGVGRLGVARLDTAQDLQAYAEAVARRHPFVAAGALSVPHPPLPLPRFAPDAFFVEPFVQTDAVMVSPPSPATAAAAARSSGTASTSAPRGQATKAAAAAGAAGAAPVIDWEGAQRWVEVSIGLLGVLGHMRALGPSLTARLRPQEEDEQGQGATSMPRPSEVVHLASIPEAIAKPEVLDKARERAVDVADWLGVSGLAQLDGYMHVDSGELIVSGLDLAPDLSAASPLYAQAAHHSEDPQYPHELLRSVVLSALAMSVAPESSDSKDAAEELLMDDDDDGFLQALGDMDEYEQDDGDDGVGAMPQAGEAEEADYQENWK